MSTSKAASSPHKCGPSNHRKFSVTVPDAQTKRKQEAFAMTDKFAGPMDPKEFLNAFLPTRKVAPKLARSEAIFTEMRSCQTEKDMYLKFVECAKAHELCGKYELVDTSVKRDSTDEKDKGFQLVDMGLYLKEHAPDPSKEGQRWNRVALFAEFKTQANTTLCDPFEDNIDRPPEPQSIARRDVRGQIINYAAEIFARQHRTHVFSLIILGEYVRLVRWDRSGAVFTERIPYVDEPRHLSEFLWRFTKATPEHQGYDVTATEIKEGTRLYKTMLAACRASGEEQYKLDYFKRSCDREWPWYKLRIDVPKTTSTEAHGSGSRRSACQDPDTEPRYFLVGKPHAPTTGLTGRATRGYIAWDLSDRRLVFLKDCWRVKTLAKEGDTIERLNKAGIESVPTLLYHGDVAGQVTVSPNYWKDRALAVNKMKSYVHYRLVVKEIGCHLDDFTNSRELVKVIYECIYAHAEAYEEAHILHRDVSVGNILILRTTKDGKVHTSGLLNDWDLAKDVNVKEARQSDRTGTWQFMSARLLRHPSKIHEVHDDIESFLHVLLYQSLSWLPREGCSSVASFMNTFFDEVEPDDGEMLGGIHKTYSFITGGLKFKFKCAHLEHIVKSLFTWFRAYYILLHEDRPQVPEESALPSEKAADVLDPDDDFRKPSKKYLPTKKTSDVAIDAKKVREVYEEAAGCVQSHSRAIKLFTDQLKRPGWPANDKELEVQVEDGYTPDPWVMPRASRAASKRSISELTKQGVGDERRSKKSRSGV
ncbi:hypothetical protein GLOTRDRAFT_133758 [Gloeophyllum trabeum ATCC 11539]|uniref:Fungal-type protein kinase domain-containing protein n=1 Tax=Gloeophyllum trabeum (strain ATCC 11539 / FP-39264 / Madison 617) TaxID=670483 RepID=S7PTK0_GLOTA|nr:uncharacterized protein GLOTRDRAFT_133758 [Gloeophyllum trabeum ATCC 11539]EPQ50647.1 hypothetical protein GLOTRDRAFT_133758 [Gloeophyllum trabeum ATCC 11539]